MLSRCRRSRSISSTNFSTGQHFSRAAARVYDDVSIVRPSGSDAGRVDRTKHLLDRRTHRRVRGELRQQPVAGVPSPSLGRDRPQGDDLLHLGGMLRIGSGESLTKA